MGAGWLFPLALAGTVLTGAYMARALRLLWAGEKHAGPGAAVSGAVRWMGAGIAVLVALAAVLGSGFPALERLLGAEMPISTLAMGLGLSAGIGGLLLGWFVPMPRLLGPVRPWAARGFVLAGGFDALMLRPALAIAAACERLEQTIYNAVLGFGRLNPTLGIFSRQSDERAIDGMIFALVRRTIAAGARARRLQSGLIHREMALTVIGIGVIAAVLIAVPLYN